MLGPGDSIDLASVPGWTDPTSGKPGDAFYLRADQEWRSGWRLSASVQMVAADQPTPAALQPLAPLLLSQEVVQVKCR
jgi:hypothetical protein